MTEKEIRQWMRREKVIDSWYASVDGHTYDEPMRLSAVFRLDGVTPESCVLMLHVDQAEVKDPPWIELDTASELTTETRKAIAESRFHSWLLALQAGALLVVLCLVLYFVLRPEPSPPPPPADPIERLVQAIDAAKAQDSQASRTGEPHLPALQVHVAGSGRLLYVSNVSSVDWPGFEITLDGPPGYRYEHKSVLPSQGVVQVPMREFVRDGTPYPYAEEKPKRVEVVVPGYRPFKSQLR